VNPKQFLLIGGIVLLVLGLAGFAGLFSDPKAYGGFFWLDTSENVAHTVLGVVAIAASYVLKDAQAQKWLVVVVGVVALFFTIYGLAVGGDTTSGHNTFGIANLESPADDILHLVVGVWALWAAFRPMGVTAAATA
jgi:uncharacterized protein DUF4383